MKTIRNTSQKSSFRGNWNFSKRDETGRKQSVQLKRIEIEVGQKSKRNKKYVSEHFGRADEFFYSEMFQQIWSTSTPSWISAGTRAPKAEKREEGSGVGPGEMTNQGTQPWTNSVHRCAGLCGGSGPAGRGLSTAAGEAPHRQNNETLSDCN